MFAVSRHSHIIGNSTEHAFGSLKHKFLGATSEGHTSFCQHLECFIIAVSCYEIYISVMNATARLADLNDVH